jgi:threonine dehydrogenase-like Zn-dependent dehydrogenase
MMLAAKRTAPGRAELIEVATPEPGAGEALVRVRACAICASDLPGWNEPAVGPGSPGEWDSDNPGLTGHEIAGDIAAAGPGVASSRVGEAVWIDPIAGCGACEECAAGRQTFCPHVSIVCQGFAEYVDAPARQCRPVPPEFDYVTASMIGDMAGTPVGAVKRAGVKAGEVAAVWGLGPVGLGLVQAAAIAGAGLVVGLDPVAARRERAERFGAATVDPSDGLERLRELTNGRGPDVVLSTVSAPGAVRAAFDSLRDDGRMVTLAGFPPAGGEVRKWVSGSWGCDERHWPEVIEHLQAGRFRLDGYVTHQFVLADVERAFTIRERDLERSFKVVVTAD